MEREKNEKALNKTNHRGRRILETSGEVANGKFLCPSPYPKQLTLSAGRSREPGCAVWKRTHMECNGWPWVPVCLDEEERAFSMSVCRYVCQMLQCVCGDVCREDVAQ